ncbi:MAG: carboxylesterase family protein [Paludibacteraceae bacterium]|nr:carboxylesterase family protein [Paludibacteraceae bacterium]
MINAPIVNGLSFAPSCGTQQSLTMPDGTTVSYTAYERLYYVTNVEDSAYQYLNIYVPQGADEQTPIFLRTYVGGYMAAKAQRPKASDASGRALQEGYVVVVPGTRGRNSRVGNTYTGRAPKAILDLKAAIRYLRRFDAQIAGNTERIITDGTSAGGAMSALMGGTGNHPDYEPMLQAMGAADERDDVFAAVCFCPITDLDHADMAYEWLYNGTRHLSSNSASGQSSILAVSGELAAQFPAYLESLDLYTPDGTPLRADNYLDYIKSEIIRAAQIAKNAGADIPENIGFTFSTESMGDLPPINGGVQQQGGLTSNMPMMRAKAGEYILDLDMPTYLAYVVSTQPLKTAPAFDTKGVCGQQASGENDEFGDESGSSVNFTRYGLTSNSDSGLIARNVHLMNPMNYIRDKQSTVAPYWYIRHGARDRDTSFPIPLNLALMLQNEGKDVNLLLAWNRPHSGDYALDELFGWISDILAAK